jgi:hypothetical protein
VSELPPAPADPIETPSRPPALAGDQVAANTRNIGVVLTTGVMILGVMKEHGIDTGAYVDPKWGALVSDPRILVPLTIVTVWAGNLYRKGRLRYRKSRLRRIFERQLDRLGG